MGCEGKQVFSLIETETCGSERSVLFLLMVQNRNEMPLNTNWRISVSGHFPLSLLL